MVVLKFKANVVSKPLGKREKETEGPKMLIGSYKEIPNCFCVYLQFSGTLKISPMCLFTFLCVIPFKTDLSSILEKKK